MEQGKLERLATLSFHDLSPNLLFRVISWCVCKNVKINHLQLNLIFTGKKRTHECGTPSQS
jgi:hypothetical protein